MAHSKELKVQHSFCPWNVTKEGDILIPKKTKALVPVYQDTL